MLEFVDSGLYFVQDKNNFINLLLQVGSGPSTTTLDMNIVKCIVADPDPFHFRLPDPTPAL